MIDTTTLEDSLILKNNVFPPTKKMLFKIPINKNKKWYQFWKIGSISHSEAEEIIKKFKTKIIFDTPKEVHVKCPDCAADLKIVNDELIFVKHNGNDKLA